MNVGEAIQGPQNWSNIRMRCIMVRVKGVATDAGGVKETLLPAGR